MPAAELMAYSYDLVAQARLMVLLIMHPEDYQLTLIGNPDKLDLYCENS